MLYHELKPGVFIQFFLLDTPGAITPIKHGQKIEVDAPPRVFEKGFEAWEIEYYGNAEPIFYDQDLLDKWLNKAERPNPNGLMGGLFPCLYQDYTKPVAGSFYCFKQTPQFSFLSLLDSMGVSENDLINYGVILYTLK